MTEAMHEAFKLCTQLRCPHFYMDHGIIGFMVPDPTLRRKPRTRVSLADIPNANRRLNYYAYITAVVFLTNVVVRVRTGDSSFTSTSFYAQVVARFSGAEQDITNSINRRIETLHDFNISYGMEHLPGG